MSGGGLEGRWVWHPPSLLGCELGLTRHPPGFLYHLKPQPLAEEPKVTTKTACVPGLLGLLGEDDSLPSSLSRLLCRVWGWGDLAPGLLPQSCSPGRVRNLGSLTPAVQCKASLAAAPRSWQEAEKLWPPGPSLGDILGQPWVVWAGQLHLFKALSTALAGSARLTVCPLHV